MACQMSDNSLPPSGQSLIQELKTLVETLHASSVRYAIIGGIATIQHRRIRTTADINVLLTVPQIARPAFSHCRKGLRRRIKTQHRRTQGMME